MGSLADDNFIISIKMAENAGSAVFCILALRT